MAVMMAAQLRPGRLHRLLARFRQARGGSTAVEFAMLALPFLGLLFGIIELGMIYVVDTTLENATVDAARQIRTCQLQQTTGVTAASFRTLVCNEMTWMGSSCAANLQVDVRTFSTFASTDIPNPVSNGQFQTGSLMFQMGSAGDIVLVRTYYPWTLITPLLDGAVQDLSNGAKLISATTTFRNEPCS
jgi:Flp pilus assembly protein TadG